MNKETDPRIGSLEIWNETIEKQINEFHDKVRNIAIDNCIEAVRLFSKDHSIYNDPFLLFPNLITELYKLKSDEDKNTKK